MDEQRWILGISASHNGSACLLKGDEIVVAIQEERLTRFKRHRIYGAQPSLAVRYVATQNDPHDLLARYGKLLQPPWLLLIVIAISCT